MAQQLINIGEAVNDKRGDPLRTAFDKVNQNFTELYNTDTSTKYHLGDDVQFVDVDPTSGTVVVQSGFDTSMPVYIKGGNCSDGGIGGDVYIEAGGAGLPNTGTTGVVGIAGSEITIESDLGGVTTFGSNGQYPTVRFPEAEGEQLGILGGGIEGLQNAALVALNGIVRIGTVNSNNTQSLGWVFDQAGTINIDTLFPITFTITLDEAHYAGEGSLTLSDDPWEYNAEFVVSQNGQVEIQCDDPIFSVNPGYTVGNEFAFTEVDHGIPNYTLSIVLLAINDTNPTEIVAGLTFSFAPEYPSTINSLGAIKLTSNDNSWVFGTNGFLTLPSTGSTLQSAGPIHLLSDTGTNQMGVLAQALLRTAELASWQTVEGNNPNRAKVRVNSSQPARVEIEVESTAGTKLWTFDQGGNISLPEGGDILDFNGDSVLGSGGGNTGNISFDSNGAYAGIYNNQGGPVYISNFSYVTQEAETAWIQIPAGNSTDAVRIVQEQGNVWIEAQSSMWNFQSDGKLTFPDGLSIKDSVISRRLENITPDEPNPPIVDAVGSKLTLTDNSIALEAYNDPDGLNNIVYSRVTVGQGTAIIKSAVETVSGEIGTTFQITGAGISINSGDGVINNNWSFNGDGLTFPDGATLYNSTFTAATDANAVLSSSNGNNQFAIYNGGATLQLLGEGTSTWTFNANGVTNFPNRIEIDSGHGFNMPNAFQPVNDSAWAFGVNTDNAESPDTNIWLQAKFWGGNDSKYSFKIVDSFSGREWKFDGTGNLTLPTDGSIWMDTAVFGNDGNGNLSITSRITDKGIRIFGNGKAWNFNADGTLTLPSTDSNESVIRPSRTDRPLKLGAGTSNYWKFGTDGILTLPGSNYLETTDVNLKVGSQGTVTIRSNAATSEGTKAWTFGTDGKLTAPNEIVISTDNTHGGTGYTGFLTLTSTQAGVTNPNKFIRLNSTGNLQIINSEYTGTILDLADNGDLTLSGTLKLPAGGDIVDNNSISVIGREPKFEFKNQTFTAVAGKRYAVDNGGMQIGVILPANPSTGDAVYFVDAMGTFSPIAYLTMNGNGNQIMGAASQQITTANESIGVFYNGNEWRFYG